MTLKSMKGMLWSALLSITFTACTKDELNNEPSASPDASNYSNAVATKWNDMELALIQSTPGFVPPVAARALAYTHLSAYEAISPGIAANRSVDDVMHYDYELPENDPEQRYNWALVANGAYFQSVRAFYANADGHYQSRVDSLYQALKNEIGKSESQEVISRSDSYGAEVADAIYNWSVIDKGHEGYTNLFPASYSHQAGPGKWEPTPPAFQSTPLLPYWGYNRPFMPANISDACLPVAPYLFSSDTSSNFYKDALEVFNTYNQLSQEQKDIAYFWADGSGTYTPPGHNMNIATQLLRLDNVRLDKAAEVYLRMGLACNDAFIACWKVKYEHNIMRPVTFIKRYISAGWMPLINTPPFPEYTSGHSSVSAACSEVLSAAFGSNRPFTDHTNESIGLAPRTYNSFTAAANEAAMSRLYGGIHFPNGNTKGTACGKQIGKNVVGIYLLKK
ncbi:MAG: vanadium-dependent haloperoxidase [Bacteroidetes bacterium]|nr:vanadium-dependent haloperoxidase [Bacteroidota bacterium]